MILVLMFLSSVGSGVIIGLGGILTMYTAWEAAKALVGDNRVRWFKSLQIQGAIICMMLGNQLLSLSIFLSKSAPGTCDVFIQ